jgi:hypothetical protein
MLYWLVTIIHCILLSKFFVLTSGFNAHAKCELKVPLNCPKSTCDKSMTLKGEISKTPQIDTDHWKLGQLVRSIYEYPGAALNSPQEDGDTFWVHEGDILEIIDAGEIFYRTDPHSCS